MREADVDLDALARKLTSAAAPPDIMNSQCNGGGGSTTGASPGCEDMLAPAGAA